MADSGLANRLPHFAGLACVQPDGLFANDVLAQRGAGHHGFVMQGVGGADQHQVDLGVLHNLAPVVGQQPGLVLFSRGFEQVAPASAERDDRRVGGRLANFPPIRRADKPAGAQHSHAEFHDVAPWLAMQAV